MKLTRKQETKLCINCHSSSREDTTWWCLAEQLGTSLVTGQAINAHCYDQRRNASDNTCGPTAKWFKPMEANDDNS